MFGLGKKKTPTVTVQEKLDDYAEYLARTPDIADLAGRTHAFVFVYSELLLWKQRSESPLAHATEIASAWTDCKFSFWKRKLGQKTYGFAMQQSLTAELARIKGKVLAVPTYLIPSLDKYHVNGVKFNRREVNVLIPTEDRFIARDDMWVNFTDKKRVFMYIGNEHHFDVTEPINGYEFEPVSIYPENTVINDHRKIERYYYFAPKELNVEISFLETAVS